MTKLALNLLLEQDSKEQPFEFTEFPILVKGTDVFKQAVEVGDSAFVDPEPISKQFRAIRRAGNWPKALLRTPNLEHRVTACLLNALDHHVDGKSWNKIYIYIETGATEGPYYGYGHLHMRIVTIGDDGVKELTGMNFTKIKR